MKIISKTEMKKICKPFSIEIKTKWSNGFLVTASNKKIIMNNLKPLGFIVHDIAIGPDYNRKVVTRYVEKTK